MSKITTKNYFETIKKIGFEKLPLVLKQSHTVIMTKTDNGADWNYYKSNKDFKRMTDLAFLKLQEFLSSDVKYKEAKKPKGLNGLPATIKYRKAYTTELAFMKEVIAMNNQFYQPKELYEFITRLKTAFVQRKITKMSPFAEEMNFIQDGLLEIYNNSKGLRTRMMLKPETIKYLESALERSHKHQPSVFAPPLPEKMEPVALSGIEATAKPISSIDFANIEFETIGFKGKWLKLFGDPSKGFKVMVLGMPKMGKSILCIDFASYLAKGHGKVLYVSKEEFMSSTLSLKINELNAANDNLDIAGAIPDDLSAYDFVFLDSVTSLKLSTDDLKKLEEKNPNIGFVYVFQVTKAGKARGTNEFMHNVDMIVEFTEKGKANQNGRFNQGGEIDVFNTSDSLPVNEEVPTLAGIKKKEMEENYPSWTKPRYLSKTDHDDLKTIYRLYTKKKFKEAMAKASDVDTIVRDKIPGDILKAIGGTLTEGGEERLLLQQELPKQIDRLKDIVEILGKEKNPNWSVVASLANLHQSLGEYLIDGYSEHTSYSKSLKEGMTRHTKACKSLIKVLEKRVNESIKRDSLSELHQWKKVISEWNDSYSRLKKTKPYEGKDYADEFRTLKDLHEDNIGRKFSDHDFNEIFSIAKSKKKNLEKLSTALDYDIMGFLTALDEATDEWDKQQE
jgi:hypothetical protein